MSNYKVGDLASLFPSPPVKKSGKALQSLFSQQNNKNKTQRIAGENIKKMKFRKSSEDSASEITSASGNKAGKRKFSSIDSTNENQQQFKKQKGNKNVEAVGFIRSNKNKKQRKMQLESFDTSDSNIPTYEKELFFDSSQDLDGGYEQEKKQDVTRLKEQKFKTKDQKVKNVEPKKLMQKFPTKISNASVNVYDGSKSFHSSDDEEQQNNNQMDVIKVNPEENEDLSCTLFVGNLPMSSTKKMVRKLFRPFGPLKTVRLRGAIASKSSMPKKVAEIKNKYHKSVQSHKGFVVFNDREAAVNALSLNGTLVDNHHILVDFATKAGGKKLYDGNLSIFIGNLPFDVDDETVWSAFEECGEVHAVRIIRDKNTGLGKGFGYVQFQDSSSREKALTMEELEIGGRKIRIKSVDTNSKQKMGSKESLKIIRNSVAMKRSKESGGKKSVKKLLKKGRRLHRNKQIARMFDKTSRK